MSFWWWVLIFVGIGVVGLACYALIGLWLWRKVRVLLSDVGRLSALTAQLEATMATAGGGSASGDLDF